MLVVPSDLVIIDRITVATLLKIVALFSSLESLGYLGTRLVGAKNGLLLQGLCGGFISSTMTYLRMTRSSRLDGHSPKIIAQALLLSTIAMLLECGFIIYTLHAQPGPLLLPILGQIVALTLSMLWFQRSATKPAEAQSLLLDTTADPIIWKKMIYLSLFIVALTYAMRFIGQTFALPYAWSAFFVSLFEAHGVLVAAMAEYPRAADLPQANLVVLVVLAGNVVSKTFFVLRSKRRDIRSATLVPLYVSLLLAVLVGVSGIKFS